MDDLGPACADPDCTSPGGLDALAMRALLALAPPQHRVLPVFAALSVQAGVEDDAATLAEALRRRRVQGTTADAAFRHLANELPLSDGELLACALARAVELDPLAAPAVAALQGTGGAAGDPRPSLGLALRLAAAVEPHVTMASLLDGKALRAGVLVWGGHEDLPLALRTLKLHPSLLLPFPAAGRGQPCDASFGHQSLRRHERSLAALPASWQLTAETLSELAADSLAHRRPIALILRAAQAGEAAAMLASSLGAGCAQLSGAARLRRSDSADAGTPPALEPGVEAWLLAHRQLPLFVVEPAPGECVQLPEFRHYRGPLLIAAGREGDVEAPPGVPRRSLRLALPPAADREHLWRQALGDEHVLEAPELAQLATRYRIGVCALEDVARSAVAATTGRRLRAEDVQQALQSDIAAQARGLSALAEAIALTADVGSALVLPGALQREMELLSLRCSRRESLVLGRGPALQARYAPGVRALLLGASGTGKTLAAQWLAQRLGKPLFRVDLAAVSSKYIGETEKNLSELLSRAEQIDAVLLFDEADSLFGARTEVRQANDRFANSQTNYLLQRIESFEGIALLTSNNKQRFDEAFLRRLDHVIDFPLPSVSERRALWTAHLGAAHTFTQTQLNRLAAEVDLAGGHIRNIVLAAALSAGDAQPVGWPQLLPAVALEYAKLGRRPPDALLPPA